MTVTKKDDWQKFLRHVLQDPSVILSNVDETKLPDFDPSVLDNIPETEKYLICGAFLSAMPDRSQGVRKIKVQEINSGAKSVKKMLEARGLEVMSNGTQKIFLDCPCWPIPPS